MYSRDQLTNVLACLPILITRSNLIRDLFTIYARLLKLIFVPRLIKVLWLAISSIISEKYIEVYTVFITNDYV